MRLLVKGSLPGYARHLAACSAMFIMVFALTGCLYPKNQLKQNQVAPKDAIRNVQASIDQYQAETGLLPIKNSTSDTPKYEKYYVDFTMLLEKSYLSEIPSSAFEKGGNFNYLIIDEETKPRVKLIDIQVFQKIIDIQSWVTTYIQSNKVLPKGVQIYPGYYQIDYKVMKKSAPTIQSVFSGQTIQAIVDDNGVVYTDYGIDIMQFIQKSGKTEFDANYDLRALLVDGSDYVPIKAPVYHFVNNEPQAVKS